MKWVLTLLSGFPWELFVLLLAVLQNLQVGITCLHCLMSSWLLCVILHYFPESSLFNPVPEECLGLFFILGLCGGAVSCSSSGGWPCKEQILSTLISDPALGGMVGLPALRGWVRSAQLLYLRQNNYAVCPYGQRTAWLMSSQHWWKE